MCIYTFVIRPLAEALGLNGAAWQVRLVLEEVVS